MKFSEGTKFTYRQLRSNTKERGVMLYGNGSRDDEPEALASPVKKRKLVFDNSRYARR